MYNHISLKKINQGFMMEILKSFVSYGSSAPSIQIDNTIVWPLSPSSLLTLYLNSAEHCRCVQIKANSAYGAGFEFANDADAAAFENACDYDPTEMFVDLGIDIEVFGNAWLETVRNGKRIELIRHLPALTMHLAAGGGHIQRVWNGYKDITTQFSSEEAMVFRVSCPSGNYYSYPSWIGCHGMIELAQAATAYNERFFSNRAIPEYCITTTGYELTQEQKEVARNFFSNEYKGLDNAHRTLYLHLPNTEAKIEFKRITSEVKDGDFLNLLASARERIPMAHGVPMRILGVTVAAQLGSGTEVAGQLKVFEDFTLKPMRNRLMAQLVPLFDGLGIDRRNVQFKKIDTTVDSDYAGSVDAWVASGLLDREEARGILGIEKKASVSKLIDAWLAL